MIRIDTLVVTEFSQNGRVLACSETNQAVILDPGGEPERFVELVEKRKYECVGIWLTHCHLDHCGAVAPLLETFEVPLVAHPGEKLLRSKVREIAQMYGLNAAEWFDCPEPTVPVSGGETLTLGNLTAEVRFTPGHSPGSVSFLFPSEGIIFSGDVLFAGSIGRTDFPGSDHATLISSIRTHLLALDDSVRVLSGHGPDTTIGRERQTNPFLTER